MAKSKVTPIPPAPQSAPKLIGAMGVPLERVSITWHRPAHFAGEDGEQACTITGARLAEVLAWLGRSRPGLFQAGNLREPLFHPDNLTIELEGIGEILWALADVDLSMVMADSNAIFRSLGIVTSDLVKRAEGSREAAETLKTATVTAGAPAAPEAAR